MKRVAAAHCSIASAQSWTRAVFQPLVVFTNSTWGLSIIPEMVNRALGGPRPAFTWLNYEAYDSPPRVFYRAVVESGVEAALRQHRAASDGLTESQRNNLGYRLLFDAKKTREAIEIFNMNVEAFPKSFNVYDSLGEAYMAAGEKELAIRNYEKSLELNPKNTNGMEMLKKLRM